MREKPPLKRFILSCSLHNAIHDKKNSDDEDVEEEEEDDDVEKEEMMLMALRMRRKKTLSKMLEMLEIRMMMLRKGKMRRKKNEKRRMRRRKRREEIRLFPRCRQVQVITIFRLYNHLLLDLLRSSSLLKRLLEERGSCQCENRNQYEDIRVNGVRANG
jgi:hypothetical protein